MVNCNPETVSTDYDTVDRLYFEPLTFENVHAIIEREKSAGAEVSCVVQYGGQTPLKLALSLQAAGVKILGTSPDSIDLAEDRSASRSCCGISAFRRRVRYGDIARRSARRGDRDRFPCGRAALVRAGRAGDGHRLRHGRARSLHAYAVNASPEHPILIDKFLEDATEIDVDALPMRAARRHRRHHGAHRAGRHPLRRQLVRRAAVPVERQARRDDSRLHAPRARGSNVVGLMNTQFAIKDDVVYVLEVNPRASRTIPYLSKATGMPLAKVAARLMIGQTLAELGLHDDLAGVGSS
jgi:carbamoyl-phosphate synthase large subunit